ncbi:MAG TPA: SAM-dependent methyltransferase [Deltaproteobacteria bacterium]|nr:SAM-dependent methyltransferase [Deltaproteobacteria bacterium]
MSARRLAGALGGLFEVEGVSGPNDKWTAGDAYENYMGRWSRPLARAFISWLAPLPGAQWLDVGCGTGALTRAICELAGPATVVACDPSCSFVDHARKTVPDDRVSFVVTGAEDLPGGAGAFDRVVSGLVLNFVADPARAIGFMIERLRRGGMVAAYVWDYSDGLEFLRCFWDEAVALDPLATHFDEGLRFPLCRPGALNSLFVGAGLRQVVNHVLEVPTRFQDFQDFWTPFLRGTGPAPSYAASLSQARRDLLRERLYRRLKVEGDGSINLRARAWAVSGMSK